MQRIFFYLFKNHINEIYGILFTTINDNSLFPYILFIIASLDIPKGIEVAHACVLYWYLCIHTSSTNLQLELAGYNANTKCYWNSS